MRSTNEKRIKAERKFNRILIQAILEGLDFGEIVLCFIELNSQVKRSQIGEKPELFAEKLEEIFGSWTADIFEERHENRNRILPHRRFDVLKVS